MEAGQLAWRSADLPRRPQLETDPFDILERGRSQIPVLLRGRPADLTSPTHQ